MTWQEVVAEHPAVPLPLLVRAISRHGQTADQRRQSPQREDDPMESARLLKALSRLFRSNLGRQLQRREMSVFLDHPLSTSADRPSVQHSRSSLVLLEPEDNRS